MAHMAPQLWEITAWLHVVMRNRDLATGWSRSGALYGLLQGGGALLGGRGRRRHGALEIQVQLQRRVQRALACATNATQVNIISQGICVVVCRV
jgi:hypothetical protein